MTTLPRTMEIPVSEFELLARSCQEWRTWATDMEYALVGGNDAREDISVEMLASWTRAMPATSVLGILREGQHEQEISSSRTAI